MTEVSPKIQNEIFTITESTRVETTNDIEEQVSKKSRSQLFPLKRKRLLPKGKEENTNKIKSKLYIF